MALFYYGSRIREDSKNMIQTPEGYLICKNVPIGRTGMMQYIGREIRVSDRANELIDVYRDEEDVFSAATLASFEGKPVTEGHPASNVDNTNYNYLAKGHIQNVRKGTGEDSDKILADLFITDQTLIEQILNGKREVSSGYNCDYIARPDGTYMQKNIIGNHVAVVSEGRAGSDVAIRDSLPEDLETLDLKAVNNIQENKGGKSIVENDKNPIKSLLNILMNSGNSENKGVVTSDASVVLDALTSNDSNSEISKEDKMPTQNSNVSTTDSLLKEFMEKFDAKFEAIEEKVNTIDQKINDESVKEKAEENVAAKKAKELDKLLSEIDSEDAKDESMESVTVNSDDGVLESNVSNYSSSADSTIDAKKEYLNIMNTLKPVISKISNNDDANMIKSVMLDCYYAKFGSGKSNNTISNVFDTVQSVAKNNVGKSVKAMDSVAEKVRKREEETQAIYDSMNPHINVNKEEI